MEESREERKSSRLNMTSRLNQAMRWGERRRMRRKGAKEKEKESVWLKWQGSIGMRSREKRSP